MGSARAEYFGAFEKNMNGAKKIVADIFWSVGIGPALRAFFEPDHLIVAYHSIDTGGAKPHLEISPGDFKRHLLYLRSRGYSFLRFSEPPRPERKNAFIYFDDGFKSVKENAHPILKRLGIPATLFITTDYLDQKSEERLYMNWEEVKSISDIFEFGSHAVSHRKLNKIPLGEAREEMARSKKIIEERLGRNVAAFSYPYGRSLPELEKIAHELGYRVTTADKKFRKARPDPDDSFTVFKIKTGIAWL